MTTPTTQLDLDAVLARAEAATPGEWTTRVERRATRGNAFRVDSPNGIVVGLVVGGGTNDDGAANAAFIASARQDIPALVAELRTERARAEKAEAERDELREQLRIANIETDIAWHDGPPEEVAALAKRLADAEAESGRFQVALIQIAEREDVHDPAPHRFCGHCRAIAALKGTR